MTLDERDLLQEFLHDLIQVRVAHKDPVAEALIVQACTRQPDALYILVQRLMIAERALHRLTKQSPPSASSPSSSSSTATRPFLDPSILASTALGVVAGSLIQQGVADWLASEDLSSLPGLDDLDL
jgi:hypothetical protein